MIRFGVVLSVVLVAIGLLAAGVVSGSLLLVVVSIGVAALAFLLLVVVVVMSRHELFGLPAGQAAGLRAIEPTASVPAAASAIKARSAAGSGAAAPAAAARFARAGVAAQPEAPRSDTGIRRGSKGGKDRGVGVGQRERVAPAGSAGRTAPASGEAEPGRETTVAKAGVESKADKAAGQPVADRPATTPPDRAAAAAQHDAPAPVQRRSGAPQTAKDVPAAGGAVAAGRSAATSTASTSPPAASTPKDKRGGQVTPAVQLIDAAAAKAKAGAEEVMQEAATGRPSAARSDQTAASRPPATASAQDRDQQKEYRASKLERESARAAGSRAAGEPGGDAKEGRGSATASAQGTPPEHPAPAGQAAGKPADRAGSAESPEDAEAPQVSVVPGITRYHRGDCLLIRFLSPDDLEVMTRQAAIDSGCAPCKACKPDGETAGVRAG